MPSKTVIDPIDAKILTALTAEPRATVIALADVTGLSRNTVQARLSKLEQRGVLHSFERRIDPGALGYPLTAFILTNVAQRKLSQIADASTGSPRSSRYTGSAVSPTFSSMSRSRRRRPLPHRRAHPRHRRRRTDHDFARDATVARLPADAPPVPDRRTLLSPTPDSILLTPLTLAAFLACRLLKPCGAPHRPTDQLAAADDDETGEVRVRRERRAGHRTAPCCLTDRSVRCTTTPEIATGRSTTHVVTEYGVSLTIRTSRSS